MVTLSITGALSTSATGSFGVPGQEWAALRPPMRRYLENWLKERRDGDHAWSMDPYNRRAVDRVKEVAARVKKEKVHTVLWLGIGGSGLGPKVIQEAFEDAKGLSFIVVDTIDPFALSSMLTLVDWSATLVVVVSKSGGTLETMSAFFLCWEHLKKAMKRRASARVIGVTDPRKGPLKTFCLEQGIDTLSIGPDVGGRYSIFSPVGLLPLALLGRDVDAFVRGAKGMDELCQRTVLDENPAAQLAATQYLLDTKRGLLVRVIMPYSHRLQSIGRWNQQLIAESLGKKETSNPIPLAALGTQDQHSLLQQWLSGPRKMWHLFIREREKPSLTVPRDIDRAFSLFAGREFGELLDACADGTARALTRMKRPHATLTLDRCDEENLGQLFFLLLTEVVLLGKLYRIDPYGQPSVEIGKTLTKEILSDA